MTLAVEEQAAAVRATASALAGWAADTTTARSGLALAPSWSGLAADAAAQALHQMDADARAVEDAHTRATDALRRCASELEHAAALQRRAAALAAQDHEAQSAAARARAMLRAATTVGPPLPAYVWEDASPLVVASRRLAAEAEEVAGAALRRAAAELEALRPRRQGAMRGQLRGFGRGAWTTLTDTARMLELLHPRDPVTWWRDFTATERGLLESARHPLGTIESLAGVDQLRDGAYGEWLGGLLAGAVIPGGRGGRLGGRAGRTAVRLVDKGGPVRVRLGLRMPARYPVHITDLEPARRRHILDGDETGGGHRAGTGNPTKTEFPASWSDDEIIDRVMQTAMRPDRVLVQDRYDTLLAVAEHHGVTIKVAVTPDGRVITAYPQPGGAGVVDSLRRR